MTSTQNDMGTTSFLLKDKGLEKLDDNNKEKEKG